MVEDQKIIRGLLEEGKKIQEEDNFKDYKEWKMKVQFNMEDLGTPIMKEEIRKEINKKPLWITYTNAPEGSLEAQFRTHDRSQLNNLISILKAANQIKLAKNTIKIPNKIKRKRQPISQSQKNTVFDKQEGKCHFCKKRLNLSHTEFDHIEEVEQGGKSTTDNLRAACANCHSERHNRDRAKKIDKNKMEN